MKSLRAFRDSYVKANHPEAIEEYYLVAPKIVAAIGKQKDSQSIYKKIYSELVLGTLQLIENGQDKAAYDLYRNYSISLQAAYC